MSGDDETNDNGIKSSSRRGGPSKGSSSRKVPPRVKSGSSTGTNSTDQQQTPPQRRRRKKTDDTESPPKYDNTSMTTPAIAKIRNTAKKPPTLNKRHNATGVTPSVVTQMKFQKGLVSDDDDSENSIDMEELLAEDDDKAAKSRSSKEDKPGRGKNTAAGLQALGTSRRKRKDKMGAMNKSMSSVDGPARSKSAGEADLHRSFVLDENKKRSGRKPKSLNASGRLGSSSHKSSERRRAAADDDDGDYSEQMDDSSRRKKPGLSRAKSDGEGKGKLKNALKMFSGGASDEPPEPVRQKKSFSTTLSALQNLATAGIADAGEDDEGREKDLRATIMQQVQRSSSNKFEMNLFAKKGVGKKGEDEKDQTEPEKQAPKAGALKLDRLKSAKALRRARTESNIDHISSIRPDGPIEIKINLPSKRGKKAGRSKSFDTGVAMRKAQDEDASESEQSYSEDESGSSDFMSPRKGKRSPRKTSGKSPTARSPTARSPRSSKSRNVITLLKKQSEVTEDDMVDTGNRRMFHALMYKTKLGIDMDKLREVVQEDAEER